MGKRYFAPKRKKDPSLNRIIVALLVAAAAVYGIARVAGRFSLQDFLRQETASSVANDLDQARALHEAGDDVTAASLLGPILARVDDPAITPYALLLQAAIDTAAGDPNQALERLQRAYETYPDSPIHPQVAARYARLLEDRGENDAAVAIYEALIENAPPEMRAAAHVGVGRKAEREQDTLGAREWYRKGLEEAAWGSEDWNEAADALGRVNVSLIFAPMETPESKHYAVEEGDNLTNIGIKLNTTQGLLERANGIADPSRLSLGQRLKYTPKDFRIVIERATCRLFLVDKEGLFKRYYVGLGMPGYETMLGKYTIGNKQKDPTWFKPGSEAIPPGDPRNELGTRWMPLVPAAEGLPTDLGIHGTIAPETIGQYKSHGCPRMAREDVEELYDLVVRSTPVDIVQTWQPAEHSPPKTTQQAAAQ